MSSGVEGPQKTHDDLLGAALATVATAITVLPVVILVFLFLRKRR